MMLMEDQPQAASEDEDENLNFPPLPALPPEAGAEAGGAGGASSLLGMASPARDLIRDIEHKF